MKPASQLKYPGLAMFNRALWINTASFAEKMMNTAKFNYNVDPIGEEVF